MKKIIRSFGRGLSVALALSVTSLVAHGQILTYSGNINPSAFGNNVTTSLPMFNSSLGTLTGVQVTLDFSVTPYATIFNFSGGPPLTFDSMSDTSGSLNSTNNLSVTYGTDSWLVTSPTVTTGPIDGTGQVVPYLSTLTFDGGTSAPADLTSVSGLDFAAYTGAGDLTFGVTGPVYFQGGGPWYNNVGGHGGYGGAGADVAGTASVTYDYTPVPEPTTLALAGLSGLSLMLFRRRK